eukprot:7423055-Ditylum_brightwellii.AAC.1
MPYCSYSAYIISALASKQEPLLQSTTRKATPGLRQIHPPGLLGMGTSTMKSSIILPFCQA